MALPERAQTHCTYADCFGWGSDERHELIDGQAYAMGPARVAETVGWMPVGFLPEIVIDWSRVVDEPPRRDGME